MYPRLDAVASTLSGMTLEDLSAIRGFQPYATDGPVLSRDALDALGARDFTGTVGRELRAAGLVASDGRLSPAGLGMVAHWESPRAMIEVSATSALSQSRYSVWTGEASSLVAAGPVPLPGFEAFGDTVTLATVPIERTIDDLVAWLGIAPAWMFGDGPIEMDEQVVRTHGELPLDAGPHLRRLWGESWSTVLISVHPARTALWLVLTNSGYLQVALTGDGRVHVEPISSGNIYLALVEAFGSSLS